MNFSCELLAIKFGPHPRNVLTVAVARDGGSDELDRDRLAPVVEQARISRVLVAGQNDDVVEPAHPRQQAAALRLVADPAVRVEQVPGAFSDSQRRSSDIIITCWATTRGTGKLDDGERRALNIISSAGDDDVARPPLGVRGCARQIAPI